MSAASQVRCVSASPSSSCQLCGGPAGTPDLAADQRGPASASIRRVAVVSRRLREAPYSASDERHAWRTVTGCSSASWRPRRAEWCGGAPTAPPRTPPPEQVGRRYAALPRRDTAPEVALRRELHRRGRRFRVGVKVPGLARRTIDVVFPTPRVAVFVDGCFWHGCPLHSVAPRSNAEWWQWKLRANRERDADTTVHLEQQGWTVVRVWEHEPVAAAADTIEAALRAALLCKRAPAVPPRPGATSSPRRSTT